ncbi:hypothetical protein [Confluentibacter sediminis]|uniref:hypothetical protein n=1 Tax=Confluentibacter sediminis TaxID=2219045 RepID=UPI0013A6D49F|nr:hypothetical protein [Confluentibacter sediminis]
MKNILGNNNYRFGVESFLLMYLNQYQFVLGSDLEYYGKIDETFTKDNPCNIYFVLRRPKVTIDPNSVKIKGKKADFELIIHHPTEGGIIKMGTELNKAKSELEFHTEYPYNLFTFSDKKGVLFGARPSTLIDSVQVENNVNLATLDYEVLYIGQAYGKNGKRTALDRLSSHETVQKIYTHSLTQNPDSDIWILLTNFSQQSILFAAGADLIKVSKEDSKIEHKKEEHFFENNGISITEKQKINFTEAALIKYFQPKYNIEFKDSFPSTKHKSYSECYNLDIKALIIELDTSENTRKIFTEKTERTHHHMKIFEFNSDEDRISLMNIFG